MNHESSQCLIEQGTDRDSVPDPMFQPRVKLARFALLLGRRAEFFHV
ncbi:hypothetical protein Thiofri_03303 [Thiorhodovibrio frisius]|nr:hypothetical protein Thiofri_03303 [Thiorhodovibrio frisius]